MGELSGRLKRASSRAGRLALGGALAIAITPALAFGADLQAQDLGEQSGLSTQHYDYKNNTGKVLSDTLNGKVKRVDSTNEDHVYQYMGYVHSDGSHYSPYSLYTEITTDANGIVTALDLTSGNDMWAGKWGNMTSDIEGFLPDGVDFKATQNTDGTWSPSLQGAVAQGYKVTGPTVTFISTNATGTADVLGIDQSAGGKKQVKVGKSKVTAPAYASNAAAANAYDEKTGKITVPTSAAGVITSAQVTTDSDGNKTYATDDQGNFTTGTVEDANYYNLVKCAYTLSVGEDKTTFNTYFSTGTHADDADKFIDDVIGESTWNDSAYNSTNRDGWTGITGTLALRMLSSWNAYLQNPNISTDPDGELGALDTVSGATKTSRVFVEALGQAKSDGFIKGVSENVQVSIDKGDSAISAAGNSLEINSKMQDATAVVKNDDGTYTVNARHRLYGGGFLSLLNVYLYDLSGQTVGTVGMKELAKNSYYDTAAANGAATYQYLKAYNSTDTSDKAEAADKVTAMAAYNAAKAESTTVADDTKNNPAAFANVGTDADDYISLTYTNSSDSVNQMPITLTTKATDNGKKITHVVFRYKLGHAAFSMAYDLEQMSKVSETSQLLAAANAGNAESVTAARAAYSATPYDVRPFVAGLDNLEAAEAGVVAKALSAVSASDKAGVEAARKAYDALDPAIKAKVDASALKTLTDAETTIANNEKEAAAADKAAHTVKTVTLAKASVVYNGKAQKPAVTVKASDGKTLPASAYDVAYSKNTNVGTATVTVKGKGSYTGSATATFKITKAANKVTLKKATKKVVLKKVKKKAQTVAIKKATVTKGAPAAKYSITKALKGKKNAKKSFSINTKTGKITVKKGTAKGTYKVTVKAASGNANYKTASATAVITINVK